MSDDLRDQIVKMQTTLLWYRHDLRLTDHPALEAAVNRGNVVPVYLWAPDEEAPWSFGAASKWWLHHSLSQLSTALEAAGTNLIVRAVSKAKGAQTSAELLTSLVEETGATAVYWSRRYEPAVIARDTQIKAMLKARGVEAESFNASLLFEPWEIETKSGGPYRVFTPFYRTCLERGEPQPPHPKPRIRQVEAAANLNALPTLNIADLKLLPQIRWDRGFENWTPGADAARQSLTQFLKNSVVEYPIERDRPDHAGTSQLSASLHFGEISPREAWHAAREQVGTSTKDRATAEPWLRQLIWREFAHHLLYHFPQTPTEPLRPEFARFPWVDNPAGLKAWQQGQTGYPIVDAGMRQLWATGWMHNRVRMIVGSFLVKDLRISWEHGATWFWDTLIDADLANNTLGWQWIGGCGADAAPYFRVFNPVTQGEKFDPDGTYVRQWVPELARLPSDTIHHPWDASPSMLREAGVTLGKNYPRPLVDHAEARKAALAALATLKQA